MMLLSKNICVVRNSPASTFSSRGRISSVLLAASTWPSAAGADAEIALRLDIAYQFSGIVVVRMRSTASGIICRATQEYSRYRHPYTFTIAATCSRVEKTQVRWIRTVTSYFFLRSAAMFDRCRSLSCRLHQYVTLIKSGRSAATSCVAVYDRLIAAAGLRREYLKRKGYFILIQKLGNLHVASPMFLLVFLFNKKDTILIRAKILYVPKP